MDWLFINWNIVDNWMLIESKEKMDIKESWKEIRNHFNKSFSSNFHVSIASVDSNHLPTVTPIGTLFLNDNLTGFYFEKYPKKLPKSAKGNKTICVLAVNSGIWFWLKSLYRAEFKNYPAIKLYGELGEIRKATNVQLDRLNRRMKITKWTKGNKYLWGDMKTVREIVFTKAEKANIGKMTNELE